MTDNQAISSRYHVAALQRRQTSLERSKQRSIERQIQNVMGGSSYHFTGVIFRIQIRIVGPVIVPVTFTIPIPIPCRLSLF